MAQHRPPSNNGLAQLEGSNTKETLPFGYEKWKYIFMTYVMLISQMACYKTLSFVPVYSDIVKDK